MATKAKQATAKRSADRKAPAKKSPAKKAPAKKAPAKKGKAGKAPAKAKASRAPAKKAQGPVKRARQLATKAGKSVEGYVAKLGRPLADVVASLREIIHEAVPNVKESIKWAQPVYEANGPFAFIKAFRSHVNFGFWRGADLPDPEGILAGDGDRMRHVKLSKPEEIRRPSFLEMVRHAVRLNQEHGDPTQRKARKRA